MDEIKEVEQAILKLSRGGRGILYDWLRDLVEEEDRIERLPYLSEGVGEPPAPAYSTRIEPYSMSVQEYLEFEEKSATKHEYVAGLVFAMSGPTEAHETVRGNLFAECYTHLRGSPCRAFGPGLQLNLKIDGDEFYYHPDMMVVCGEPNLHKNFRTDPRLIIEVLSPSTQNVDRREKYENYRKIATLEEYIVVAQGIPEVTIFRRAGSWLGQTLKSVEETAEFRSIQLSLPLARIYEGVL